MPETLNEILASLTEGLSGNNLSIAAGGFLADVRAVFPDGLLAAAVTSGSPPTIASVSCCSLMGHVRQNKSYGYLLLISSTLYLPTRILAIVSCLP
jgi:hypothetical protein